MFGGKWGVGKDLIIDGKDGGRWIVRYFLLFLEFPPGMQNFKAK